MKKSSLLFLLLFCPKVFSQVEIKQMNLRFAWIRIASKYVKAGLTYPKEGLSICFMEVRAPNFKFDFVTRRAVPYDECMFDVMTARKILQNNKFVEIIGTTPLRGKAINEYFAMWDLIEGGSSCVSFFGGDECKERSDIFAEMKDWQNKAIDPKIYP